MHKLEEVATSTQDLVVECAEALGHMVADLQYTKVLTGVILKGTCALTMVCMKDLSETHDTV